MGENKYRFNYQYAYHSTQFVANNKKKLINKALWVYFSLEKLSEDKCWILPNLLSPNNFSITYSTHWNSSLFTNLKLITRFLFTVAVTALQLKINVLRLYIRETQSYSC